MASVSGYPACSAVSPPPHLRRAGRSSTTYYHTSVTAGAQVSRTYDFRVRRIPLSASINVSGGVSADADIFLITPNDTFATPVLGGQLSAGLMTVVGAMSTGLSASINGALSTPIGGLSFARTGNINQSVFAVGDLYPQLGLRWNFGVHNLMTYLTGDIPVGYYNSTGLANIGIGHGAIDGGGGYTYLNPENRPGIFRHAGLHLQFPERGDRLPERCRHAPRPWRLAVPQRAPVLRRRRLPLQGDRLRHRRRPRHWAASSRR